VTRLEGPKIREKQTLREKPSTNKGWLGEQEGPYMMGRAGKVGS